MIEALNPTLYDKLLRYYDGDVDVVAAGEAISWELVWERTADGEKVASRRILSPGEEYRVRCKACKDHRARLQINHMWGVQDEATNSRNLWLAHCWNEECYSDYAAQKRLFDAVYALGNSRKKITVRQGRRIQPGKLQYIPPPGIMYKLETLAERMPNHDAIKYLVERGFDPVKLGRLWGVQFCAFSQMPYASNRIIIPIHAGGIQVGWQARYVGDDVNGLPFNEAGVPKYYTSPKFPRRLMAYNLERALPHSTVVIVEGPTDVWNTGLMSIGLLGKSMSPQVAQLIINGMQRHGADAVVVVMLDPKKDAMSSAKNKPHPIDKVCSQLWEPMRRQVLPVWLPIEHDPGSIDRQWARELIREEASKLKLKVSFSKPN
jgi:hypothetical protein